MQLKITLNYHYINTTLWQKSPLLQHENDVIGVKDVLASFVIPNKKETRMDLIIMYSFYTLRIHFSNRESA